MYNRPMNRTDRLLAIVLELQARGRRRAEDLAATFETSKRTIYRDIEALCEAGVPVVAVPGQGYSLVEGYFLPPLQFRPEEATVLLLGADFMAQNFDAHYRTAAQTARSKIEAVLPARRRAEVQHQQSSLRFITLVPPDDPTAPDILFRLRQAVIEGYTVRFAYHARAATGEAPVETTRLADPYGLVHIGGAWYMVAYCHLRQAVRHFRLARVSRVELLDRRFTRPPDFQLGLRDDDDPRAIVVRALFAPGIARWVREARSFFTTAEETTPDGLLVTLRVRREDDVLGWLLSWGGRVRVLEPDSLRTRLLAEAAAIMRQHQDQQQK